MNTIRNKSKISNWLSFIFGAMLFVSFFLAWVSWKDELVSGYAMASGDFFKSSVAVSGPENPFPKLSFSFYIFWLIPVLAILSAVLVFLKKKVIPFSYLAGTLSLALVTVYYLFSQTLATDFSVGKSVTGMLKPSFYLHALAAIGLIVSSFPAKTILPKIAWLLIGPVFAYTGYKMGEKYIMSETHTATEKVQADYTVNAAQLINEFISNDTATNKKYKEKMLIVNGNTAAVEIQTDSTSTIKFADSTGSYVIFSFEKNEFDKVKTIKNGDPVSLKGVCSGSIFSDILGTTAITFKRSTLNKK
jgi:uncharacterized MnhB-related membrane protein